MENIIKKNQFVAPVVAMPNNTNAKQMQHDAWQKLRDSGMTTQQVADLFGVCRKTIENHTFANVSLLGRIGGAKSHMKCEARKAYYIPIMMRLRELGYNNVDIAQKTGFCNATIASYIGEQPDEITLASMRAAGAKRRFRNLAKKNQPCHDNNEPIPAVAEILKSA